MSTKRINDRSETICNCYINFQNLPCAVYVDNMYVYILYIMCVFLLTFDANDDDDDSVVIYESPASRLVKCYVFYNFHIVDVFCPCMYSI